MAQEFALNQNRTTILVVVFVVLLFLVFLAGYLSGTLVGLPEPDQPLVTKKAPVEPPPKPAVEAIQVPQVVTRPVPKPEVDAVVQPAPEPEPEPIEEPVIERLYSVQVGAFRTAARAETQQAALAEKGYRPYIYHGPNSKGTMWYTVRVGDYDDVDDAIMAAREFRALEGTPVTLTHYDSLMMIRNENGKRIEIAPPVARTKTVADEASAEIPAAEDAESEPVAKEHEPVAEEPKPVAVEPETVAAEPEPVVAEPETVAKEPEPVAAEPEPVTAEPEPVAAEPETLAKEPEPVAAKPEPVADEPEPLAADSETIAEEPETVAAVPDTAAETQASIDTEPETETVAGQSAAQVEVPPAGSTAYRVTFSLPTEPPAVPPVPAETSTETSTETPAETSAETSAGTPAEPQAGQVDETASVGGLIVAAEARLYAVQVGAFLNDNNAVKFAQKLRGYDYPAYVFRYTDTGGNAWSAVRIGDFESLEAARAAAGEFEAKRNITAIVTKIDGIKMILK